MQQALATSNRSALVRTAREVENSAFYSARNEFLAGRRPGPFDAFRSVRVNGPDGQLLGRVVVHLPFDDRLAKRLGTRAALDDGDRFAFVANGQVIAPEAIRGELTVPHQQPRFVSVGGTSYRALGTELLAAEKPRRFRRPRRAQPEGEHRPGRRRPDAAASCSSRPWR